MEARERLIKLVRRPAVMYLAWIVLLAILVIAAAPTTPSTITPANNSIYFGDPTLTISGSTDGDGDTIYTAFYGNKDISDIASTDFTNNGSITCGTLRTNFYRCTPNAGDGSVYADVYFLGDNLSFEFYTEANANGAKDMLRIDIDGNNVFNYIPGIGEVRTNLTINISNYKGTQGRLLFKYNHTHASNRQHDLNLSKPFLSGANTVRLIQNNTGTTLNLSKDFKTLSAFKWEGRACDTNGDCSAYVGQNRTLYVGNFTPCNASGGVSDAALNFTIKDEKSGLTMNATSFIASHTLSSADSATFNYDRPKNTTYTFCLTPTDQAVTDAYTTTYSATSYPARSFDETATITGGSALQRTLYLLNDTEGSYSTFTVTTIGGDPIDGVSILAEKQISGSWTTISRVDTGGDGGATFWLDSTLPHRFTFSKAGYVTLVKTITPTQSQYYTTLQSSTGNATYDGRLEGITWKIGPPNTGLASGAQYNFTFQINSTKSNIYGCAFNLTDNNNTYLAGATGCAANLNGSIIHTLYTPTAATVFGKYYVKLDNTSNNYIIVEGDARFASLVVNDSLASSGTLKSFLSRLRDYPQWGSDSNEEAFSAVVAFFIGLAIIMGLLSFFTGVEISNPGYLLVVFWVFIFFGSVNAWFATDFVISESGIKNVNWFETYWLLILVTLANAGWWGNHLANRRGA